MSTDTVSTEHDAVADTETAGDAGPGQEDSVADGGTPLRARRGIGAMFARLAGMSNRSAAAVFTVLALLLGGEIAAIVVFAHCTAEHSADAAAARAATEAARSRVPAVLSYDHNTIDTAFPALAGNLTGKFRDDFTTLGTKVIIPAAHRDSITTKATVVGNSVVSVEEGTVTVLMFLNQETTGARYQGPRLDGSRVRVTMTEQAGTWLISDITPV
ncbi:hypothetical protein [Nocardia sp. R7R-8]|uniref:hypothetical protein n=1 Tax=Nocardia sp. R7R-8 TaxID=3459304 RepID=UPI00403E180A